MKNIHPARVRNSHSHPEQPDAPASSAQAMDARDRVLLYTGAMGLPAVESVQLALESLQHNVAAPNSLTGSMDGLDAACAERGLQMEARDDKGQALISSAPPILRSRMVAEEMDITPLRSALKKLWHRLRHEPSPQPHPVNSLPLPHPQEEEGLEKRWLRTGFQRRLFLLALILIPSLIAGNIMYSLLPVSGMHGLRLCISILFVILFGWISLGFWSSLAGLAVMARGGDRFVISKDLDRVPELPGDARTALLFPVYNENAHAVAAGIRAVFQDLRLAGQEQHFDIFILSDSTNPEAWVLEEEAWHRLCREENAFGRIFYRRRKTNLKRKSGNIADFCRRWGAHYRYMIIFDADSLMSAGTLSTMVRIMECHPTVGILQTPPKAIKSRSLISRAQQFANHLYGPIFAAGLHYWQLNNAQYWGHNAIIRVEPFMRHCQLPKLPGPAPLGGEIMSHDFVESALMRRAGYGVWLAYDLGGSYEQTPPSLIDELIRDRRWCQGNLQHSRLIFTRGFFPTHRALFVNGILSYGSALLWLFFLLASSAQAIAELFIIPDYFPGPSLFPSWPQYFPVWALGLLSSTLALLFLPKVLALALITFKGGARCFGGFFAMCASTMAEVIISTFLAPVRMLFHSTFIITGLLGKGSGWNAQNRDDRGTSWLDALRFHWWGTALGGFWGWLMYMVNPGFFLWLSPIVLGLLFSIPLSVWTSRISLGEGARSLGLFLTPVDVAPPSEIQRLDANLADVDEHDPFFINPEKGFRRAVVIPSVFALHRSLLHQRRSNPPLKSEALAHMIQKALDKGPDTLSKDEKLALLADPKALTALHRAVWRLCRPEAAEWGIGRR